MKIKNMKNKISVIASCACANKFYDWENEDTKSIFKVYNFNRGQ